VVKTVATADRGVAELLQAVAALHADMAASGELARRRREYLRRQFEDTLRDRVLAAVRERALAAGAAEAILDRLVARTVDPLTAAVEILKKAGLS
jgi:putative protein kinase ArgK-like GTPase of G3E family